MNRDDANKLDEAVSRLATQLGSYNKQAPRLTPGQQEALDYAITTAHEISKKIRNAAFNEWLRKELERLHADTRTA